MQHPRSHSPYGKYSGTSHTTHPSYGYWLYQMAVALALIGVMSFLLVGKSNAASHIIEMTTKEIQDDGFGRKLMAYQMKSHTIDGTPVPEDRYSKDATIPGPTIVLTEGDTVELTLYNEITNELSVNGISKQVSVHVHGVHYELVSDGTLAVINKIDDEGAGDGPEFNHSAYVYKWTIAPGTAGTWPYHDHNFESHNGSEHKGLFGAVIVNPAGSPSFAKEYVLYLGDDAFWGMEIDGVTKQQSKHGANPPLEAKKNSDVRFHLIALGTDIHTFMLNGYQWFDPGTNILINKAAIGPLEKHVFTVKAKHNSHYVDKDFSNQLMGMKGSFNVH